MFRKPGTLAILSLLLVPVVSVFGVVLANFIDPEFARRSSDYERNYMLLNAVRSGFLLATLLATLSLWFLTCFFLLKSKEQSYAWLLLAVLGPFGLIVMSMLGDNTPAPGDWYRQLIRKLNIYLRVAYELCLFVAVWVLAFQTMLLKRELMILFQSARTGMSVAQIVDLQNASSGMWAFSEGLEVLFLVALFYLLWPLCVNAVGYLVRLRATSRKA